MSDGYFVADLPDIYGPGDLLAVTGEEAYHMAVVRRLLPGEAVTLTDGKGRGARCHLTEVSRTRVDLRIASVLTAQDSLPWVIVVQAIPKTDRGLLAVDLMTEAGVDAIIPWAASRCQVKWSGEAGEKARGKWVTTAREASKQSRRLRFPFIGPVADTGEVAGLVQEADCALVMHETATQSVAECIVPGRGRVVIVIGPEGGLTEYEIHRFEQVGGQTYLMGPTVLRTSTAGAVAVSQVRLLAQLGAIVKGYA